jgi:protein-S-isoprenylcysteine O-methyltransferase Ste14
MTDTKKKYSLPKSVSNLTLNWVGVLCGFICIFIFRAIKPDASSEIIGICTILSIVVPIILYEVLVMKVHLRASAKLRAKNAPNYERVVIKLIGLVATFALLAGLYRLFPEYHKDFFNRYWDIIELIAPFAALGSIYYFYEVDLRMEQPEDAYYFLGCAFTFQFSKVDKDALVEHFRQWMVKGFFLPLMYIYLLNDANFLMTFDITGVDNFLEFYDLLYTGLFTIDVAYAAVGYMMTFKLLDSHIRSAEPTFLGWVVALMCYSPFWSGVFYGSFFSYNDGHYWGNLTDGYPIIKMIWGCTILLAVLIYCAATVSLGYRFSNLTYRGLVTNGVYRFTKHPAYVSKNISWWLISVPFISHADWELALRHSLMLLGVNFIYYMRARTEENHLSNYPDYVEYANWMNEHGILRFVTKVIPYFRYSEERAKAWHSEAWWKRGNTPRTQYLDEKDAGEST